MEWSNLSVEAGKSFFDAPLDQSRRRVNGGCNSRELCLLSLVSNVPAQAVGQTGALVYTAVSCVAKAIANIFRAIAFRKGACKAVVERLWTAIDCLAATAISLISAVIKAIRCVLGAVIHPVIAARANTAILF